MNHRTLRSFLVTGAVATCITTGATVAFADTASSAAPMTHSSSRSAAQSGGDYDYYLALGDSLAWGTQPNSSGTDVKSGHGYADDLAAYLRGDGSPNLDFVDLACPGETTGTMLNGGCSDLSTSGQSYTVQETAAVAFLRAHPNARILVTLDIGANNVDDCTDGLTLDVSCVQQGTDTEATQLPEILAGLKAAAGTQVRFVGMNLYNPFLAGWLLGAGGQTLAWNSAELSVVFNQTVDKAFAAADVPVADVSDAFESTDFTDTATVYGETVPVNVANICNWTWVCATATSATGPDIHANDTGYAVIADTFEAQINP